MLLALKQGGIAVFTTRIEYLTTYGYGDYIKKLEDEGKWKKIEDCTFKKYTNPETQNLGRFKEAEMTICAYQKL